MLHATSKALRREPNGARHLCMMCTSKAKASRVCILYHSHSRGPRHCVVFSEFVYRTYVRICVRSTLFQDMCTLFRMKNLSLRWAESTRGVQCTLVESTRGSLTGYLVARVASSACFSEIQTQHSEIKARAIFGHRGAGVPIRNRDMVLQPMFLAVSTRRLMQAGTASSSSSQPKETGETRRSFSGDDWLRKNNTTPPFTFSSAACALHV